MSAEKPTTTQPKPTPEAQVQSLQQEVAELRASLAATHDQTLANDQARLRTEAELAEMRALLAASDAALRLSSRLLRDACDLLDRVSLFLPILAVETVKPDKNQEAVAMEKEAAAMVQTIIANQLTTKE